MRLRRRQRGGGVTVEPTLGQQFLDVSVAQGEAEIQPTRVLDDLGREAMTAVEERSYLDILSGTPLSRLRFRDNAVTAQLGEGKDTGSADPAARRSDTPAAGSNRRKKGRGVNGEGDGDGSHERTRL